jgi:UDP-N-acetylglucosamine--N-acetylmuramyl-(pentapeptide) pyrophosphoryl-undecaprenol N-acetylglucosamine transferase
MEKTIVENSGVPFYSVPAGKMRRHISVKNIFDVVKILIGFASSFFLLAKTQPALLFSKGGYVSVPPCWAAKILKIPVITHESDMDPGLATRLNGEIASRICVSWEDSPKFYPEGLRHKVVVTGNPVREEILHGQASKARSLLQIDEGLPVLLVLGGSQGASRINSIIRTLKDRLTSRCFIIHQTGGDTAEIPAGNEIKPGRYVSFPYIGKELPDYFAAADIVISRAGANTLCELAALEKPSILIPLSGGGTRGDQLSNAAYFESNGASIVFSGGNPEPDLIYKETIRLIDDPDLRREMGKSAGNLFVKDAGETIARMLIEYMEMVQC